VNQKDPTQNRVQRQLLIRERNSSKLNLRYYPSYDDVVQLLFSLELSVIDASLSYKENNKKVQV
jgi:hypothetical protein